MDSLQLLREMFPGQINLPLLDAGKAMGFARQTIKNKVHDGTFPIHVARQGGMRVCHILNVADYLDGLRSGEVRKKRGRPTKAEVMGRHLNARNDHV